MFTQHRITVALTLSAILMGTPAAFGEEQPIKITELVRVPVEGVEGKEVVVFTAEFAPGVKDTGHYHSGQEVVYVLEGSLTLNAENPGKLSKTGILKAGDTSTVPREEVHAGGNASNTERGKALVFIIADEGKPLAVPAK